MVTTPASLSQTAPSVLLEILYDHLTEEEKSCLLVVLEAPPKSGQLSHNNPSLGHPFSSHP